MINFFKWIFSAFKNTENLLFVRYFVDEQGIKTLPQIKNDYVEVFKAFSSEKVNNKLIMYDVGNYDIFKIYNDNELVASVFINKCKYYTKSETFFSTKMKEEDAVEIYSLYVNEKYRGRGYAREILYYSLRSMKDHYNLPNSFIIGLHLNEADKFMNVSFSLYYAMNFRKSTFVKLGPSSYAPMFQKSYKFRDPIEIINDSSICEDSGCFFAMYTRYSDFLPFNLIRDKNLLKIGEKLRNILQDRKSTVM